MRKRNLHFVPALACIAILFSFSLIGNGCNQIQTSTFEEDSFLKIKREGIMHIGYILAPPWCFRDPETGQLKGTYVEIIEEIARRMDVRVEYIEATFGTFIAGLQTKKYDLSIAPTFSTIPRAKAVAFTRPLEALGNSAIVRKNDSRFNSLKDIDQIGIVVAVTQGEQGHEFARTNFKNAAISVLSGGDQNLTFLEVLTGRADVALGDAWFTAKFAERHPAIKDLFADNPYYISPAAWSVRYEDIKLLLFINTSLDYLDSIGKLREIYQKYDSHGLRPKQNWEIN